MPASPVRARSNLFMHLADLPVADTGKFFQAQDTFGDNPLLHFDRYQQLLAAGNFSHPLVVKGLEYQPTEDESDVVETTPPALSDELGYAGNYNSS